MIWQVKCTVFLLSAALSIHATDTDLKSHILKSGRVIHPKSSRESSVSTSSNEKMYFIGYETKLELSDLKTCREEAEEYWDELRPAIEKVPGISQILIQAERPTSGLSGGQGMGFRQFKIHRNIDGSWTWTPSKAVAPTQKQP